MLVPHESLLLDALRGLPIERQEALARSCIELLTLTAHHENCPGIGVDGFPCMYPQDTCEHCHELVSTFVALGR